MKTKAAVLWGVDEPLEVADVELAAPGADEVRVRIDGHLGLARRHGSPLVASRVRDLPGLPARPPVLVRARDRADGGGIAAGWRIPALA